MVRQFIKNYQYYYYYTYVMKASTLHYKVSEITRIHFQNKVQ